MPKGMAPVLASAMEQAVPTRHTQRCVRAKHGPRGIHLQLLAIHSMYGRSEQTCLLVLRKVLPEGFCFLFPCLTLIAMSFGL